MHWFSANIFHLLLLSEMLTEGSFEKANHETIFVNNGMTWGLWGDVEMCPLGTYASGFSLKVERKQGIGDDTALNGIALRCTEPSTTAESYCTVKSETGSWGTWTQNKWCTTGFLEAFQLQVESRQGLGDDTAANNIRFKCSDGKVLEGAGMHWGNWGDWGSWSSSCKGRGICGIQTRVEQPQGIGDDTALNDVKFYCCEELQNVLEQEIQPRQTNFSEESTLVN